MSDVSTAAFFCTCRKMQAALNQEVVDGGKVFPDISSFFSRCYSILGTEEALGSTEMFVDSVHTFLKAILPERLVLESEDENFCLTYLLSDPKIDEFASTCEHSHTCTDPEGEDPRRLVSLIEQTCADACCKVTDQYTRDDLVAQKGKWWCRCNFPNRSQIPCVCVTRQAAGMFAKLPHIHCPFQIL